MSQAYAVVERVEGDRAWVRLTRREGGCGRCDEPGGCRSTGIAYALKAPTELFCVPNGIGARAGEGVMLRMQDGAALKGALMTYGFGACLLVVGAIVGRALADSGSEDLMAAAGAIVGLLAVTAANRMAFRSAESQHGFRIEMLHDTGGCGSKGTRAE